MGSHLSDIVGTRHAPGCGSPEQRWTEESCVGPGVGAGNRGSFGAAWAGSLVECHGVVPLGTEALEEAVLTPGSLLSLQHWQPNRPMSLIPTMQSSWAEPSRSKSHNL